MNGKELSQHIEQEVIDSFWKTYNLKEHPGYFQIEFKPLAFSVGGIMLRNKKPIVVIDDSLKGDIDKDDAITLEYTTAHETAHGLLILSCISASKDLPKREKRDVAETLGSLTALLYFSARGTTQPYQKEVNEEGQEGLRIFHQYSQVVLREKITEIIRADNLTMQRLNNSLSK